MEDWFIEKCPLEFCSLQGLYFVECIGGDFTKLVRNLNGWLVDLFWSGIRAWDQDVIRLAQNGIRSKKQQHQQCDCDFHWLYPYPLPCAGHASCGRLLDRVQGAN